MISLNDIKKAVIHCLREKTDIRNIYGEEIKNKHFPLFQVVIIPGGSATAAAGYHIEKNLMVDILYMEEDYTSNEKNYEMLELLDGIIRPVLTVCDRNFTVESTVMEITDSVAHYKFSLNFTDIIGKSGDMDIPLMENLEMDL